MKQLWIVNVPIGAVCDKLGIQHPASGGWMESFLFYLQKNATQEEVVVLSTGRNKATIVHREAGTKYIVLPLGKVGSVRWRNPKSLSAVNGIVRQEKPDLVLVWGTEFTLGLCVTENVPIVIYMQGVLSSIARYYCAGLSAPEMLRNITFRDLIKLDWMQRQRRKFHQRSKLEAMLVSRARGVVSENRWCAAMCRSMNHDIEIAYCPLSIRSEFMEREWDPSRADRFTIMANASGYPVKGLHVLLKALRIVKETYPSIMLIIPGHGIKRPGTIIEKLRLNGYVKLILRQIDELGLKENVQLLGYLTLEALIERMIGSMLFVMPSSIENHSSSLKEAMALGMPVISSAVGGIPEYVENERNGLLYRFEDYEVLADSIVRLLDSRELAARLGANAKMDVRRTHDYRAVNEKLLSTLAGFIKQ